MEFKFPDRVERLEKGCWVEYSPGCIFWSEFYFLVYKSGKWWKKDTQKEMVINRYIHSFKGEASAHISIKLKGHESLHGKEALEFLNSMNDKYHLNLDYFAAWDLLVKVNKMF